MKLSEGYPLRKILKREQALIWLLSPMSLSFLLAIILPAIFAITNYNALQGLSENEMLEVMSPLFNLISSMSSILPLFLLPLVIMWRKIPLVNRKRLNRDEWVVVPGLNKQDWKFLAWYIPSSYILLTLGNILLSYIFDDSQAVNQETVEAMFSVTPAWVMFLMLVIAAPIVEEWLFRGLILFRKPSLEASWVTVIVSSLIFGLFHTPTNIPSAFSYIGMGFIFAFAAKRTKTVEAAIVYHMLNNLIAFIAILVTGY